MANFQLSCPELLCYSATIHNPWQLSRHRKFLLIIFFIFLRHRWFWPWLGLFSLCSLGTLGARSRPGLALWPALWPAFRPALTPTLATWPWLRSWMRPRLGSWTRPWPRSPASGSWPAATSAIGSWPCGSGEYNSVYSAIFNRSNTRFIIRVLQELVYTCIVCTYTHNSPSAWAA